MTKDLRRERPVEPMENHDRIAAELDHEKAKDQPRLAAEKAAGEKAAAEAAGKAAAEAAADKAAAEKADRRR